MFSFVGFETVRNWDSLTRHTWFPSRKPDPVDWIPDEPPDKSLTGVQFQYEAALRHRPEEFAAVRATREIGRRSASQQPGNCFRLSVSGVSARPESHENPAGTGQAVPVSRFYAPPAERKTRKRLNAI